MGNEMGNQNINGLGVSEKESNEATEIANQSPNASFVSNDSDGLKSLTGNLSDSSPNSDKARNEKLAPGELSEPKVDMSQPISSREYDDEQQSEKMATTESMKSLMVSNNGDQIPSNSSRKYEKKQQPEEIATNESMKSLNVSNNEVDQIQSTFSKEYEAAPEEQQPEKVATNESMKSSNVTKHEVDQIHSTPREFEVSKEENKEVTNESTEILATSSSQKESSGYPLYDSQKEQEAENFGGDDSLEQMAISNDEKELSQLTLPRDRNDILDDITHSTHNESLDTDDSLIQKQMPEEREEEEGKAQLRDPKEGGDELEDETTLERPNEYIAGDTNQENNPQEVLVVVSECSEQKALINNSEVIGGSINQDGGQQHTEIDLPHEVFSPLQRENKVSNEPIHVAYLDAIDFELNKLVMEDNENEVNAASKSEPNEDEYRSNKPLQEQNMDDIDANSFEIQLKAIDPYEEEKEREDGGLEEAVFEIAIQADYNPRLVSEKYRKESETERETASFKQGEIIEYETGRLENNETMEKNFSRFSSLSDPVRMIVIEMNDSNTKEAAIVSNVSERNIMQLGDAEVKEKESEDFNVIGSNSEEESAQIDEEFGDQKLVDQAILTAIGKAASPQSLKEFEQESKEEPIATVVNEHINICSNLTQDELTSSGETMISTTPKSLEGSRRFTTKLGHENFNVGVDNAEAESMKSPTHTFEGRDLETKKTTKGDGNVVEYSEAEENIKEVITKVCIQSSASSLKSDSEESDKTSLVNLLNDEGTTALEPVEKKDGNFMNKTVKELWESPSKKSMVSTARGRERQKSWSSSLFSNCMCCTTAIN